MQADFGKIEHRKNLIKIARVRQSGGIFCEYRKRESLTTAAIRPAARCRQQLTPRGFACERGFTTSFYLLVTPSFAKYARSREIRSQGGGYYFTRE